MISVCFRLERDGQVLAVFPYIENTGTMLLSYSHVGQYTVAAWEYLRYSTTPARPEEYAGLLAELKGRGYDDLKILSRLPNWYKIATGRIEGRS